MRWSILLCLAGCNGATTGTGDPSDDTDVAGPVDFDEDGYNADVDCDDDDFEVHPGADEYCDKKDNDCDDEIDEDAVNADTFYSDADKDGFGATGSGTLSCDQPPDTATKDGDCNDEDAAINPGAVEVCDVDNVDEDCNGKSDDDDAGADTATMTNFYVDSDGDGFGDDDNRILACDLGDGRAGMGGDCDDTDPLANPDLGCGYDWDGTWDAEVTFYVDAPDMGVRGTCTFGLTIEVAADTRRQVWSAEDGTCLLKGLSGRGEVSLLASFIDEDTIEGTYTFSTASVPFTAEFTEGPPTLTADKAVSGVVFGKAKGEVTHSMVAHRSK